VGEPSVDRIKKSSRLASSVKLYCFNSKADVWWEQSQRKIKPLPVSVYKFEWQEIQVLAGLVERTMDLSVSITGDSAYVATQLGECEVAWVALQEA
jgi:uncharacterized protein YaeQ